MGWGWSDTSDDWLVRWQVGTDPLTKIQGSDTWVLLDTQKTQRFLRANPTENVAIKTRQKTHPKPNCTVLFSNIFYYFEV